MAYSFTEKKRIRKNFGKQAEHSRYAVPAGHPARFLPHVPAGRRGRGRARRASACMRPSRRVFPITSYSGNATLEYVSYRLGEPAFDVKECQLRGLTYAAPLRVKVRLIVLDKEAAGRQEARQGRARAGGLPRRPAADDRQRHLRHQRHRACHRVAAASFARRVLRPRPRQEPQLGQAAVLRAHHSLSRLVARLRVRPEGLPCSRASTAAASCRSPSSCARWA